MPGVKYLKPASIQEACLVMKEQGPLAKPLAGGTDLLVQWRKGAIVLECLVDLKGLGLDQVQEEPGGGLTIGALCTLNSISNNALVSEKYPVLPDTILEIASAQVRNRATLGGNLCNASPAADMAPPLLALGARISVIGVKGHRELALTDFFLEPGKTALLPGEILTEVLLPACPENSAAVYLKHKRNAMDCPGVGVAAYLVMQDLQICSEAKVILGAVGPTPLISKKAADLLKKSGISQEIVEQAADLAAEEAQPRDDVRASAWYRRRLVKVLTARAIQIACDRAKQKLKIIKR
jgi:carbon-monoxide dehydrogenase medium subunit